MPVWLKEAVAVDVRHEEARKVRETVEGILADIEKRGDAAVRDLSNKFDGFYREDYRLSQSEIDACMSRVSAQDIADL